jgi:hypothetical protein
MMTLRIVIGMTEWILSIQKNVTKWLNVIWTHIVREAIGIMGFLGTVGSIVVGIIVLIIIIAIIVLLIKIGFYIFIGLIVLAIIVGAGFWIYGRIKCR